jgi:hypothetical protein
VLLRRPKERKKARLLRAVEVLLQAAVKVLLQAVEVLLQAAVLQLLLLRPLLPRPLLDDIRISTPS